MGGIQFRLIEGLFCILFTWSPQACSFLHLKHRLHSHLEKSIIEGIVQYFKDRPESLNDYYPSNNNEQNCDLQHLYNWIKIFVYAYNTIVTTKRRLHYFLWKEEIKYPKVNRTDESITLLYYFNQSN